MLLSVVVFKGLKPRGGESSAAPPLIITDIPLGPVDVEPAEQEPKTDNDEAKWPVKPVQDYGKEKTYGKVEEVSLSRGNSRNDLKNDKTPVLDVPAQPEVRRYTIKSGDTLSEIAQKQLGSSKPSYVQSILDMNPGVTAQNIQPGDELILPARGGNKSTIREAGAQNSDAVKLSGGRMHAIASGDSLWKIARTYYGPGNEEKGIERIVAANSSLKNGKNSLLKIGQLLSIPE
ncbi:MAG: LysM peptidoglycan-binding domain-containing protein [Planctomycetota bacterium]|nr:LysM peptidoglycan-binding domain-containing protein [Planctomycetota bacterium]